MFQDRTFAWHCVNSWFTFEGAVDIAATIGLDARLLLDSDELSLTIASQAQRDADILTIGETIILLDADGQASKMASGCRRRVPKGARIVCSFGCQPGRAQHYVAALDPVNIAARFMILHASAKDVLRTSYEQLYAERSDTTEFLRRKLLSHIEAFFGDVSFDARKGQIAHRATPSVKSMCIDSVSSRLLHSAWEGACSAAIDCNPSDPLEIWLRKGDDDLRKFTIAIALDVYTCISTMNSAYKIPSETQPVFAYMAIAMWHVCAVHRRAALDDSICAKTSGTASAKQDTPVAPPHSKARGGVCPGHEASIKPNGIVGPVHDTSFALAGEPVILPKLEPCRVLLALLVMHAAKDKEVQLEGKHLKRAVLKEQDLKDWSTVPGLVFLVSLAARAGVIKAGHVQINGKIRRVEVDCSEWAVAPVHYRGPNRSCPTVWLHSMKDMDAKVLDVVEDELDAVDACDAFEWSMQAAPTIRNGAATMDMHSLLHRP